MVINNTRQDVALLTEDPYPSDLNMSDPSKCGLLTMGQLVTKYTLKMVAPHGTIFNLVSLLVRFFWVIWCTYNSFITSDGSISIIPMGKGPRATSCLSVTEIH